MVLIITQAKNQIKGHRDDRNNIKSQQDILYNATIPFKYKHFFQLSRECRLTEKNI